MKRARGDTRRPAGREPAAERRFERLARRCGSACQDPNILAETLMELGRVEDARGAVVAGLEVHLLNDELRALMRESEES